MLSAVTICMPAFMFLSAVANLFGIGGASVIARAMGDGDTKKPGMPLRLRCGAVWVLPHFTACVLISGQIPLSICWGARIRRYMCWPRNTCSAP